MQLWIAEKPSVAKAICAELGIVKKGAGFNECKGGNTVTWCFGHLLEQAGPDATHLMMFLSPRKAGNLAIAGFADFPVGVETQRQTGQRRQTQLRTIKTLLTKADSIVNCGDPDREGQLLVG